MVHRRSIADNGQDLIMNKKKIIFILKYIREYRKLNIFKHIKILSSM